MANLLTIIKEDFTSSAGNVLAYDSRGIVKDSSGNIHTAIGIYHTDKYWLTHFKSTDEGETWVETVVTSAHVASQLSVGIAILNNDELFATYSEDGSVYYAETISGVWQDPVLISDEQYTNTIGSALIDNNNDVHISYIKLYSGSYRMYYNKRTSGVWGVAASVTALKCHRPELLIDSNGDVHITWLYNESSPSESNNIGGSWNGPTILSEWNVERKSSIINSNNEIFILYSKKVLGGTPPDSIYCIDNVGGSWNTPVELFYPGDGVWQNYPTLSLDSSNNLYALWASEFTSGASFTSIAYSKRDYSAGTWDTATELVAGESANYTAPRSTYDNTSTAAIGLDFDLQDITNNDYYYAYPPPSGLSNMYNIGTEGKVFTAPEAGSSNQAELNFTNLG